MPDLKAGATVEQGATVGEGTVIWTGAVVRENARIGDNCVLGRNSFLDSDVCVGSNCKIQDGARVYGPASIADGVFIGPGAILTNDRNPRAVCPDGTRLGQEGWTRQGVSVAVGASIGAAATVIAGISIGRWAMVGAGSVVTADVEPHALMTGVPAKQTGWVGEVGTRLTREGDGLWRCPVTGSLYVEGADGLQGVNS